MKGRLTILGCGSSMGVPQIDGDWGRCNPSEPKNRRFRASVFVELTDGPLNTSLLIDTSTDLRQQFLQHDIQHLDAVAYTHEHADHVNGIDDLRKFFIRKRAPLDVYCDERTWTRIGTNFSYCFVQPDGSPYPPTLRRFRIDAEVPFCISGRAGPLSLLPFELPHGTIKALGFRVGDLAYMPDLSDFPDDRQRHLTGLETLIINCLKVTPHPSHLHFERAIEIAEKIGARRTILTHMHHHLDYHRTLSYCPANVEPAFDGMIIGFNH